MSEYLIGGISQHMILKQQIQLQQNQDIERTETGSVSQQNHAKLNLHLTSSIKYKFKPQPSSQVKGRESSTKFHLKLKKGNRQQPKN